jgi:putative membrane protein
MKALARTIHTGASAPLTNNHMHMNYMYGPDFGFFHLLSSALWVFLIVFIISGIRRRRYGPWGWNGGPWQQDKAMEILKERYARGEIGKEEFEAKKKDLESR